MSEIKKILLDGTEHTLSGGDFENVFKTSKVLIPANTTVKYYGDGDYYKNPFGFSTTSFTLRFYDENNEYVEPSSGSDSGNTGVSYRSDLHYFIVHQRTKIIMNGRTIRFELYINEESFNYGINRGVSEWELSKIPSFIRFSSDVSFSEYSYSAISSNLLLAEYNKDSTHGLLEQFYDYSADKLNKDFANAVEHGRRLKSNVIYTQNSMRHAIRLATFNIATALRSHWPVLKECLEDYGIDICGLQEVRYPLQEQGLATLVDYFTGWAFPYVSNNGDAYRHGTSSEGANERNLLSRIPIDSTEEFELTMGTDYRYVAKSVLSLPRYMDKRGSENLKLSVYNFQLEVSGTIAQTNAQEVLDIVAEDENPFIILMGDTNDFSLNKVVWEMFENAGFKPVITTNTSTVSGTYDYNSIDNFFLSRRITALDYDVINAQKYPWVDVSGHHDALSDHDLVIADVVLDYSDIRCVNYNLTNVSASASKTWLTDEETLTITLVPDSGYSLGTITAKDCMIQNDEAIIVSGNTITLDGSKLIGDVLITCSGVSA